MRRFLVIALVLVLIVLLAGSLSGNVLQFAAQQEAQQSAQELLDARGTRIAGLDAEVEDNATRIAGLEAELDAAQGHLAEALATQQTPGQPIPTPTPPTVPTVTIDSPQPGEQFAAGRPVVVQWQAQNMDLVGRVTLSVDGQVVDETNGGNQPQAAGELRWADASSGPHELAVTAYNIVGMAGTPATVRIEVLADETGGPGLPAETAATMDLIESQVATLRGLEPLEPVTRTVYTRDDLRQFLIQELDEDMPPEEARQTVVEMAAFDLVPLDLDLRTLMEDLYTEQIAGFYDPKTRSFTIVDEDDEMGPTDESTYAHEFTHALQDQHWGLEALDPDSNTDDASLAVTALIEGDATLLMQQYMLDYLTSEELYQLLDESLQVESTVLESAPAVIQRQMMFPYEKGFEFVAALEQVGGVEAVNAAFDNPPQSTEQILHPERYLAGETPQIVTLPPLTNTLGSGWQSVNENVLGEFTLQLYLEEQVDSQTAATAADGWGGDSYAVYYRPESEETVLVLRIVWDSRAEAAEFAGVYRTYAKMRFGGSPVQDSCWSGADALCIFQTGDETLVLRAPDLDTLGLIRAEFPGF